MTHKTALLGTVTALASAAALTPAISAASADHGMGMNGSSMKHSTIHLTSMPRARAEFLKGMNGDLSVKLEVTGVTPGSQHSIDIEKGNGPTSFKQGADVVLPATVQANMGGQINQTVDLGKSASALPRGPLTLTLRQGVTSNVMPGSSNALALNGLAYTQVPRSVGHHGMGRGHRGTWRTLRPVSESGKRLQGKATYSYNASSKSVIVTIKASGFVPGSVHAAHVHAGTCTNQGAVVVMLPDLTANAQGRVSATDTVPVTQQPQGPLYINIHEGNSNTILSNGNPTLAFRPLLCGDVSHR